MISLINIGTEHAKQLSHILFSYSGINKSNIQHNDIYSPDYNEFWRYAKKKQTILFPIMFSSVATIDRVCNLHKSESAHATEKNKLKTEGAVW